MIFRFRVTGPQSISRITPLLNELGNNWIMVVDFNDATDLDFVWETSCPRIWKFKHESSTVLNRLCNSPFEDKSNLAFLELKMKSPVLDTFIASNYKSLVTWAEKRWGGKENTASSCGDLDWWVVKASRGNGGKDIWIIHRGNFSSICNSLSKADDFVVQKCVKDPLLWNGSKKFHFRCYASLMGDLSAFVYSQAFALTASLDYDEEEGSDGHQPDPMKHITNLSVNKRHPGHPGQVPVDLASSFPDVFRRVSGIWRDLVAAAEDFMLYQRSTSHFEFFGLDVIVDNAGGCWLIEANRLPGLESSSNNKEEEDSFYDHMMLELLRLVTVPLFNTRTDSDSEASTFASSSSSTGAKTTGTEDTKDTEGIKSNGIPAIERTRVAGSWINVRGASTAVIASPDAPMWRNLFEWKAYTRKNRQKLCLDDI